MSKFTPGPWKYYDDQPSNGYTVWRFENFSGSFQRFTADPNAKADAQLVEKAPEMYQLIIDLKYTLESMYNPDSDFAETADKYLDKAHNLLTEIDRE